MRFSHIVRYKVAIERNKVMVTRKSQMWEIKLKWWEIVTNLRMLHLWDGHIVR